MDLFFDKKKIDMVMEVDKWNRGIGYSAVQRGKRMKINLRLCVSARKKREAIRCQSTIFRVKGYFCMNC